MMYAHSLRKPSRDSLATGGRSASLKMAASSRVDIASAAGHSVSLLQSSKTAAKFAHDVLLCQQPSGIPR